MKSIAFIESNTTGTGELFLSRAISMGFNVYFLSNDPFKYKFINKHNINFLKIDTNDKSALLQVLNKIPDLKGLISSSEYYIDIVNQINNKLGFTSNDINSIKLCRNKFNLGNFLFQHNLAPKTYSLEDNKYINSNLFKNDKFVVKPTQGSGSVDVFMVKNYEEFIKKTTNLNQSNYILQQYIGGDEYSVEVITVNGYHHVLGITKKYLGDEPHFVEAGHDFPAILESRLEEKIVSMVRMVLNLINYKNGPTHIELKVHNNELRIIEINPRLAGGMIPIMIEKCTSIDLIRTLIYLATNDIEKVNKILEAYQVKQRGAIRFKIASRNGTVKKINLNDKENEKNLTYFNLKELGDSIEVNGNFNDRLVCVITNNELGLADIEEAVNNINIDIESFEVRQEYNTVENIGRLKTGIHPFINRVLNTSISIESLEIEALIAIDEAHILMLIEKGIYDEESGSLLLKEINVLKENNFKELKQLPKPRGLYLSYENLLINKLGENIAGNLQIGRSRNDINATTNILICRNIAFNVFSSLNRLNSSLVLNSYLSHEKKFPIYSQYQTALPGTFGHYLLSIYESLQVEADKLLETIDDVRSPLGASAGGGTILPIDHKFTSKLLGFKHTYNNSINSISNRDFNLDINNIISKIAAKISRCVQDLQVWSTREFGLIEFPDNLTGGSSAMPQKKNPYLLELLKSKVGYILANKDYTYNALFKTPLSNSFEITNTTLKNTKDISEEIIIVIEILNIIINNLLVNENRAIEIMENNYTYTNDLAEKLYLDVRAPFRTSHHYIGKLVSENLSFEEILKSINEKYNTNYSIESLKGNMIKDYGMGPGYDSTMYQIEMGILQSVELWSKQSAIKKDIIKSSEIRDAYIQIRTTGKD